MPPARPLGIHWGALGLDASEDVNAAVAVRNSDSAGICQRYQPM